MKIIDNGLFLELIADAGKMIVSYGTVVDEESGEEHPEIYTTNVCLGKYDSVDNYYEVEVQDLNALW